MSDIKGLVKVKKQENIILSFILIFVCIINIVLNYNVYYKVITNNYLQINSFTELKNAVRNKERFVSVDLRESQLEKYSLNNKKNTIDIYTLTIDNKNILVLLDTNTMITDKVNLEIIDSIDITDTIKDKLNKDYYDKILSNTNYILNRNIELIKLYVVVLIFIISLINIIVNIIGLINPTKTHLYKKYNKKLYI